MDSPIREGDAISRAKSEPLRRARSSRLGRADPVAQHLETLDAALEAIAGLQRPDARGRAGEDEIARPELVEPRECRDDVRDVPHHRGTLAALRARSEEHTSELQSQSNLVCRLLLAKKKMSSF